VLIGVRGGVASFAVVGCLYVFEDRVGQLDPGLPLAAVEQLDLIEDQKLSIMALSSPSPTVPKDGGSPAERIFSPKTQEVNWVP
jgi:hypothetical protein